MSDIFEFDDKARVERLVGTLHDPAATPGDVLTVQPGGSVAAAPGGGSMPGGVRFATMLFTEPAGPHADLVATFPVPAGSRILDVVAVAASAGTWADDCQFVMGDTAQPTGYANNDINSMLIISGPYDPTVGSGACSISSQDFNGTYDSSVFYSADQSQSVVGAGVEYPIGDTITATLSGIVTGGGGGAFLVYVMIQAPLFPVEAA